MKIVWTPRAIEDPESIVDYIGRMGQIPGTRELVFHRWSYIAVYRVSGEELRVLRIRHAAQDWP